MVGRSRFQVPVHSAIIIDCFRCAHDGLGGDRYHCCWTAAGRVKPTARNHNHERPSDRACRYFASVAATFERKYNSPDARTIPRQLHQRAHTTAQLTDRDRGTYHEQPPRRHRSIRSHRGVPGRRAGNLEGPRLRYPEASVCTTPPRPARAVEEQKGKGCWTWHDHDSRINIT